LTESSSEPFWLHQPWRVLTDILDLQKISPWELNLAELVNGFIGRLLAAEYIDFRICGRALLSAAILLRLKTEYLLEFGREEEILSEIDLEQDIFLLPIRPPFRQQVRPTSFAELLEALRQLVFPPPKRQRTFPSPSLSPALVAQFDSTHVELTKSMKLVYEKLLQASRSRHPLSFVDFVQGMTQLDIIRVFLSLLYLVSEGKVLVSQECAFGDMRIEVLDGGGKGGVSSG
jgi:segregation and condensation protein A